jgi:asparagine synthase (glutamine-hydrolysing)
MPNINININIRESYGWKMYTHGEATLWFSGYLTSNTIESVISELDVFLRNPNVSINLLSSWVKKISGHFAFVVKTPNLCFFAVDKIGSIPLYTFKGFDKYVVSNHAPYLKSLIGKNKQSLSVALEIAMSGHAIGNKTIYKNIKRLSAGECVLWTSEKVYTNYYYTYSPWKVNERNYAQLKDELTKAILSALQKTINSVNGRQIVVPLSAGNDSRLIASGLKELGYKNVICFTYGRSNNYEVTTSKQVAALLGYKWIYIQDSIKEKSSFFRSSVYKKYVEEFESYASVPNIQDVYEVCVLKSKKIIDSDAVVVNGNSGDFISGGHVLQDLEPNTETFFDYEYNWSLFLDKHYSLWKKIRTKFNDSLIVSELHKVASERCDLKSENKIYQYAVMECMECIGRQSRLVTNQQRSYEFIGHEWRLPLWSEDLLYFWEGVHADYKIDQKLYKEVLMDNNWGNVWKNIDVNNKLIRPYSLWFVRLVVKALVAPFGREVWHKIEKNVFVYWMHPTCARSIVSYWKVLFDFCGQRNTNSWTADQFLNRHGFDSIMSVSNKIKER